jgi:hypothetical protein
VPQLRLRVWAIGEVATLHTANGDQGSLLVVVEESGGKISYGTNQEALLVLDGAARVRWEGRSLNAFITSGGLYEENEDQQLVLFPAAGAELSGEPPGNQFRGTSSWIFVSPYIASSCDLDPAANGEVTLEAFGRPWIAGPCQPGEITATLDFHLGGDEALVTSVRPPDRTGGTAYIWETAGGGFISGEYEVLSRGRAQRATTLLVLAGALFGLAAGIGVEMLLAWSRRPDNPPETDGRPLTRTAARREGPVMRPSVALLSLLLIGLLGTCGGA